MNITMRREEVVHDNEVDLPAVRNLHSVQAVELRKQCVGVVADVGVVLLQDFS